MKKDSILLLTGAACAALSQIFKNSFLGYIFAGGLVLSIILYIFASIIWTFKNTR